MALAGQLGPREATSDAYQRAVKVVASQLRALGYDVSRQRFAVPVGVSWGVPVPAGRTSNVVATTPGADLTRPHLLVGAHLDTVPQAPGAVDNASGVATVLEVARLTALSPPPQPVVFVLFGAEEPRGPGDDLHHFGSQHYVRTMPAAQRRSLIGAIAVDSVGISDAVPICSAQPGGVDPFTVRVRRLAERASVPVRVCESQTSDHWSFVRNGLVGTRIGLAGVEEYPEYHSPADRPRVVDAQQVAEATRAVWAAVSGRWAR
jgi:Zn-dependent M28 family amino/carboxypeptidase